MRDTIYVNSGLAQSIEYLEGELKKFQLEKDIAIIYLQYLFDDSVDYKIVRPTKSFTFPKFDEYLRFFKRYNLLFPLFSSNTFSISDELDGNRQSYQLTDDTAIMILNEKL